ncbi:MAG: hypothetical protein LBH59_07205, partial [Planctomycetaceae bacterium]|nr:hypothetical protein [Planctomycetaceae bacterium]
MNFCYKKYITILFVIFSFILANSNLIFADRFTTKAGGKIEGEHLNNNEYPYRTYKIKHTDNVEIEIDAKY